MGMMREIREEVGDGDVVKYWDLFSWRFLNPNCMIRLCLNQASPETLSEFLAWTKMLKQLHAFTDLGALNEFKEITGTHSLAPFIDASETRILLQELGMMSNGELTRLGLKTIKKHLPKPKIKQTSTTSVNVSTSTEAGDFFLDFNDVGECTSDMLLLAVQQPEDVVVYEGSFDHPAVVHCEGSEFRSYEDSPLFNLAAELRIMWAKRRGLRKLQNELDMNANPDDRKGCRIC